MFIDFRERGTLKWERNIHQFPPVCAPMGDQIHNLGMCPDRESNPQTFGVQDNASTNWATWPGYRDATLNQIAKGYLWDTWLKKVPLFYYLNLL